MTPSTAYALEDLYSALDTEARLMASLTETLARQRAGVAADDTSLVDAATHGMTRTLLTLEEVGRRRTELVEAITGDPTGHLGAVEESLGPLPRLATARALLRSRGEQAVRDLAVTQTVLTKALRSGDLYLQTLLAASAGPRPGYTQAREAHPAPERGVLLNMSA